MRRWRQASWPSCHLSPSCWGSGLARSPGYSGRCSDSLKPPKMRFKQKKLIFQRRAWFNWYSRQRNSEPFLQFSCFRIIWVQEQLKVSGVQCRWIKKSIEFFKNTKYRKKQFEKLRVSLVLQLSLNHKINKIKIFRQNDERGLTNAVETAIPVALHAGMPRFHPLCAWPGWILGLLLAASFEAMRPAAFWALPRLPFVCWLCWSPGGGRGWGIGPPYHSLADR